MGNTLWILYVSVYECRGETGYISLFLIISQGRFILKDFCVSYIP